MSMYKQADKEGMINQGVLEEGNEIPYFLNVDCVIHCMICLFSKYQQTDLVVQLEVSILSGAELP